MTTNSTRARVVASIMLMAVGTVSGAESRAQRLASRVPDNCMAFLATSGTEAIKPAFDRSFAGRLSADANVRTFAQSIVTQVLGMFENDANLAATDYMDEAWQDLKRFIRLPMLLGVSRLTDPQGPVPAYGYVYIKAGDRKDEVTALVQKIERSLGEEDIVDRTLHGVPMRGPKNDAGIPLYWGWWNDVMIIAVNDAQGLALKSMQSEISRNISALDTLPDNGDALIVHVEIQKMIELVRTSLPPTQGVPMSQLISVVNQELGLSRVRSVTARAGFSGPYVVVDEFLALDGPRTGLLAQVKPVDPALLDNVHSQAFTADVVNCDVAGMLNLVLTTADKVTEGSVTPKVNMALSRLSEELNVDIRKDLLEQLAGPLVTYTLPMGAVPEVLYGGQVVIAELKDPNAFAKALVSLEQFVATRSQGQFQVNVMQTDNGALHSWGIGPVAMVQVVPTWTIVGNEFVMADQMDVCVLAAQQAKTGSRNNSLRSVDGFQQAAADLPDSLLSVAYIDCQTQIKQMMKEMQKVWPMLAMMAASQGIQLPMILPSIDHLMQDLIPVCSYTAQREGGIYSHYQGSGLDQASLAAVGAVALGAGIVMPALARVRQLSYRMNSGTNLAHIGKACLLYASDHDGQLPPDLQTLVTADFIEAEILESPRKPEDHDGPFYLYVPGQNLGMDRRHVVAYEDPALVKDDKINVLFLNFHVEVMTKEDFAEALNQTRQDLDRLTGQPNPL